VSPRDPLRSQKLRAALIEDTDLDRKPLMPRATPNDGLDKFQRYRANRRAGGMKLLRVWVPDPHAPGFRERALRQARLLRYAPEEVEALDFIEQSIGFDEL